MIDLDNASDDYLQGVEDCASYISGVLQTASKEARQGQVVDLVMRLVSNVSEAREYRFLNLFSMGDEEYDLDKDIIDDGIQRLRTTLILPRAPSDEERVIIDHELKALNSKVEQLLGT